MNNLDKQYLELVKECIYNGSLEKNRTGISAYTIPSAVIKHDMSEGFPLLTSRKIPYKSVRIELEGFIKGISSKKWYQERGCKYWNEWCNPQKVKYSNDAETKKKMLEEDDLGVIYGNNWRAFSDPESSKDCQSVDQLQNIITTLKTNPNDRRMLCLAWNPLALDCAALPACHVLWRVMVINNKLHLSWYQRSCDLILGIPSNIASYATLLHLLCKESGYEPGILTGFLDCVHAYENHLTGVTKQLLNETFDLPQIKTNKFDSILNWEYNDTELMDYKSSEAIKFEVAI